MLMEMLKRCIPDSIYLRLLYYRRLGGGGKSEKSENL